MAYQIVVVPMTLSDLRGHAPNAVFYMQLFPQFTLCNSWQDFKWRSTSFTSSALAEPHVTEILKLNSFSRLQAVTYWFTVRYVLEMVQDRAVVATDYW